MYHAQIGRWLQRDPLRYVDGMGLYEYCRGNALGGQDPLGLGWVSDAWEWTKNTATGIWEGLSNIVPFSAVPQSTHALPGIGNIKAAREARDLKIRLEWEGKDPDEDPNYVRLAKAAGTINMSGKAEATWKKYFGDKDKTVKKKE